MAEHDPTMRKQFRDVATAHTVGERIRKAAASLAVDPLDEVAATELGLMLTIEAPVARAAAGRLSEDDENQVLWFDEVWTQAGDSLADSSDNPGAVQ